MIYKEVIIIGAGVSGLMLGNLLKKDFIILEKKESSGKKLLISGSGQCNYTNTYNIRKFHEKFGEHKKFVRYGFSKFTNQDSIDFFKKRGLNSFFRKDGKVFPVTKDAKYLLDTLLTKLKCKIKYNSKVISVDKENDCYIVKTEGNVYKSKYLVVSTGGRTYPITGSEGDGYRFAKSLDINVTKLKNGLCSIKVYENMAEVSGISFSNISAYLYRKNKKVMDLEGDLLITHDGLSGPLIINNSRYMNEGDCIIINFLNINKNDFEKELLSLIDKNGKKNILNLLKEFNLPLNFIKNILCDINLNKNAGELSKDDRLKIIKGFINNSFKIKKVGTLHNSMVTVGGIDLKDINKKTMESKKNKNLFFTGEVLDIDGDTGGYNIQWAFSSAYLASERINQL